MVGVVRRPALLLIVVSVVGCEGTIDLTMEVSVWIELEALNDYWWMEMGDVVKMQTRRTRLMNKAWKMGWMVVLEG